MPALPLDEAGKYVAAAYVIFVLLLVIYFGIMAAKLGRISNELEELAELAEERPDGAEGAERGDPDEPADDPEPVGKVSG
jgi:hypothetical protein